MLKSANVILLFCSIFFVLDANAQKTSFGPHAGIMTVGQTSLTENAAAFFKVHF